MRYLILVSIDHEPYWVEAESLQEVTDHIKRMKKSATRDFSGFAVIKVGAMIESWVNPNYQGGSL